MKLTDDSLGAHLHTLSHAGDIVVKKNDAEGRTRTLITLTRKGRTAHERHIAFLRAIIDE